jgi:predicted DNA-binding transcriptional regulator AlpA
VTKLLDHADLQARGIKYSRTQLWRLWNSGQFPRPLKLSQSRNAWTEDEINAWIEALVAQRDGQPPQAA